MRNRSRASVTVTPFHAAKGESDTLKKKKNRKYYHTTSYSAVDIIITYILSVLQKRWRDCIFGEVSCSIYSHCRSRVYEDDCRCSNKRGRVCLECSNVVLHIRASHSILGLFRNRWRNCTCVCVCSNGSLFFERMTSSSSSLWDRTIGKSADDVKRFETVVENVLQKVPCRGDFYEWAKTSNRYMKRESLREMIRSKDAKKDCADTVLVVDVRDDDVKGGNIRGALHLPDGEFSSGSVKTLIKHVDTAGANVIVFHCMESARRGPRCARRVVEIFDACGVGEGIARVRILIGGFDQWCRAYWRCEPELIENFDDDYWGFRDIERFRREEESKEKDAAPASSNDGDIEQSRGVRHKLYTRPADQKATPWSAAGTGVGEKERRGS